MEATTQEPRNKEHIPPFSRFSRIHPWPVARRLFGWMMALLWSVLVPFPSFAAQPTTIPELRFDMFVGYDGIVPQSAWFPITFEIQNTGPTFVGTVQVTPGQLSAGQERFVQVELPSGTMKRITIPVFAGNAYNPIWTGRLLDEKRRVRAESSGANLRRFNSGILPVAAALSRHLPILPDLKSKQDNMRAVFGRMTTDLLSDNPLTYDGLDVFYLASSRAMDLVPAQVNAIVSWLHGGGHLIVGIEQPGDLTGPGSWLRSILPCEISGLTSINAHQALHQWVTSDRRFDGTRYDFDRANTRRNMQTAGHNPFSALEVDPTFESTPLEIAKARLKDGTVLIGSPEQPLGIICRRGLGQLTVLNFSPEQEAFRAWKNSPHFWAKMADVAPELFNVESPNWSSGRPLDALFGAMVDSRQVRKLPVGWLMLLLVAYLLVIGPIDQYWLKKLNRQMLTWLTFPAYVVFFSLLIYYIGYKLRAGETEWTELHVVDLIEHGPTAEIRGRSYGSIYSPVNGRYDFNSDAANSSFRSEFVGNYGNQESSRGRVGQPAQGFTAEVPVPVWTSQLFVSEWWTQGTAPIVLESTSSQITVVNRLKQPIVAARLVVGGQWVELGTIPSLGSKSVPRSNLGGGNISYVNRFVSDHANTFVATASARQQVFSNNERGRIDDWTNAVMAVSFLRDGNSSDEHFDLPRGFDLSNAADAGQAVLIAWVPGYSMIKPLNDFTARRNSRDTVFRVVAPIPLSITTARDPSSP